MLGNEGWDSISQGVPEMVGGSMSSCSQWGMRAPYTYREPHVVVR